MTDNAREITEAGSALADQITTLCAPHHPLVVAAALAGVIATLFADAEDPIVSPPAIEAWFDLVRMVLDRTERTAGPREEP